MQTYQGQDLDWIPLSDWKNRRPKYGEYVWGNWKGGNKVTMVCHTLTEKEIENGGLLEGIWFSPEYDKSRCISHWMPMYDRPEFTDLERELI